MCFPEAASPALRTKEPLIKSFVAATAALPAKIRQWLPPVTA